MKDTSKLEGQLKYLLVGSLFGPASSPIGEPCYLSRLVTLLRVAHHLFSALALRFTH